MTVKGLAELEVKLAESTKVDSITTAAVAHADITRKVTHACVSAARELLTV